MDPSISFLVLPHACGSSCSPPVLDLRSEYSELVMYLHVSSMHCMTARGLALSLPKKSKTFTCAAPSTALSAEPAESMEYQSSRVVLGRLLILRSPNRRSSEPMQNMGQLSVFQSLYSQLSRTSKEAFVVCTSCPVAMQILLGRHA